MVGVPDVAVAVGIVRDLLREHEPAPLHHERELPRQLRRLGGAELGRDVAQVQASGRHGEVAPAHRGAGERADRRGGVGPALGHRGPAFLDFPLPAGGEFPQPPDPPDGLGIEPPSAVGLSGQGDRLPGHLVQHHAVAVGAIGDAVERDGLAIQDELELMGQQRRVSLAHRGVEGLQVEAIDGVDDQVGRAVIAGDGEVEGLQRLARRRAVVPSRDVVGLPARGGGRWSRFLADGSLSRRRRTSESEDDERKPKPEMRAW